MNEPFNRADIPDPARTRNFKDIFHPTSSYKRTQSALTETAQQYLYDYGSALGERAIKDKIRRDKIIKPFNRTVKKQVLMEMRLDNMQKKLDALKKGSIHQEFKSNGKLYKSLKKSLAEKVRNLSMREAYSHLGAFKRGAGWALYDVIANAKPTQTQEHEWEVMRNDPKRRAPNYAYTD